MTNEERVVIEVEVIPAKRCMKESAEEWDDLSDDDKAQYAYDFACEHGMIDVLFKEVRRG